MKRLITLILASVFLAIPDAHSFCGFYVAKADATLFNESSQIILVRNGNMSTITMSNDFKGDVKDFAMVVPVPVVLQENQIRTVNPVIFARFDAYSAPRMAEYYDENPCWEPVYELYDMEMPMAMEAVAEESEAMIEPQDDYNVVIEAEYKIDEYDVLILSAKESDGLKRWLVDNEYKIPDGAEEVLDPYIASNMKFFVVKVNLERLSASGFTTLNPLQIKFESDKFMLPIRLGMANAKDSQDMIVYAFTRTGRLETTNYRTVKMPTDVDVPEFVSSMFGKFYQAVFKKKWRKEGKKSVMLEYAWDLSSDNYVHCDPCSSTPPYLADMKDAGVDWLSDQRYGTSEYTGDAFFTRLHVRYDRAHFPQDLQFQETPNKEQFQCRYVMRHPATGDLDCEKGQRYLIQLVDRREKELRTLRRLTGWSTSKHRSYVTKYMNRIKTDKQIDLPVPEDDNPEDSVEINGLLPEDMTADSLVVDSNGGEPDNATSDSVITDQTNNTSVDNNTTAPDEPASGNGWWYALIGGIVLVAGGVATRVFRKKGPGNPPIEK